MKQSNVMGKSQVYFFLLDKYIFVQFVGSLQTKNTRALTKI